MLVKFAKVFAIFPHFKPVQLINWNVTQNNLYIYIYIYISQDIVSDNLLKYRINLEKFKQNL